MKRKQLLLSLKLGSWLGMIALFLVISIAAIEKRNTARCQNIKIRFKNDQNLGFIDSKDVMKEVNQADSAWQGQKLSTMKFNLIENGVRQNEYVKKGRLYGNV